MHLLANGGEQLLLVRLANIFVFLKIKKENSKLGLNLPNSNLKFTTNFVAGRQCYHLTPFVLAILHTKGRVLCSGKIQLHMAFQSCYMWYDGGV
jgi:hypothetical protein